MVYDKNRAQNLAVLSWCFLGGLFFFFFFFGVGCGCHGSGGGGGERGCGGWLL